MKISKNFLLLLNILHINSEKLTVFKVDNEESALGPCQNNNNCEIECLDGEYSTDSYIESIQSIYDENNECHSTGGVKLIIPTSYFTNKTLKSNWLPVNIKIINLDVDFNKIGVFEQNAFKPNQFSNVKKFVIRNLWPEETLPKWTFTGLALLEDLSFVNAQLAVGWWIYISISYALLEFAKNTLNSLTLIERADSYNKSFLIQHMLGYRSEILVNLEYVDIKYNLTTLNALSFAAIPFVRVLDLSDCYISVIEADTFDDLSQKLIILNLERNILTTLPEGIFLKLNLNPKMQNVDKTQTILSIQLEDNPWHCGCKLLFFQDLLIQYSNFPGQFSCRSPPEIVNYPIEEADFCPYPVTTTPSPITETTETYAENNSDERECFNGDKILIQPQTKQITASVKDGNVFVTLKNADKNLIALLWFGNDQLASNSSMFQQNVDIYCVTNLREEIVISNLDLGIAYTFCSLNVTHSTISPFDCISIYLEDEATQNKKKWLSRSSKSIVCGVVGICFALSIIFGMLMSVVLFKYIKWHDQNNSISKNVKSIPEFGIINANLSSRQNDQQLDGGHINAASLDTPPPLPQHPNRTVPDSEMYYYETIN